MPFRNRSGVLSCLCGRKSVRRCVEVMNVQLRGGKWASRRQVRSCGGVRAAPRKGGGGVGGHVYATFSGVRGLSRPRVDRGGCAARRRRGGCAAGGGRRTAVRSAATGLAARRQDRCFGSEPE